MKWSNTNSISSPSTVPHSLTYNPCPVGSKGRKPSLHVCLRPGAVERAGERPPGFVRLQARPRSAFDALVNKCYSLMQGSFEQCVCAYVRAAHTALPSARSPAEGAGTRGDDPRGRREREAAQAVRVAAKSPALVSGAPSSTWRGPASGTGSRGWSKPGPSAPARTHPPPGARLPSLPWAGGSTAKVQAPRRPARPSPLRPSCRGRKQSLGPLWASAGGGRGPGAHAGQG